jgi:hypothetical protein
MCNKIITIRDGKKLEGVGMAYYALQSGDVYKDCNNDDQFYRRKYRLALCEIKLIIDPYGNKPEIKELCREINEVLRKCDI